MGGRVRTTRQQLQVSGRSAAIAAYERAHHHAIIWFVPGVGGIHLPATCAASVVSLKPRFSDQLSVRQSRACEQWMVRHSYFVGRSIPGRRLVPGIVKPERNSQNATLGPGRVQIAKERCWPVQRWIAIEECESSHVGIENALLEHAVPAEIEYTAAVTEIVLKVIDHFRTPVLRMAS